MEASKDSSAPRIDPKRTDKEKDAAPANRTSYREALEAPKEQHSRDAILDTSSGTEADRAPTKLLTLSSLSNKKGDTDNKRSRSSAEQLSDQEQPSNKKPPLAMSETISTAQNMMLAAWELPTAEARSDAARNAVHHTTSVGSARNQEKEEKVGSECAMGKRPSTRQLGSLVL